MLPGISAELMPKGHGDESRAKMKRYMTMMDSMTDKGENNLLFGESFSVEFIVVLSKM